MKSKNSALLYLLTTVMLVLFSTLTWAQCEPMSPEECPDPENNGEICPDTLPMGYLNQLYSEVATILVPLQDTSGVNLHHLTLVEVGNLPTGLGWVSNAANNEFMAGNYYCILMDGIPADTGTFYLKIVVDIYIDILGFPVYAAQVTDSTSLSMIIVDNTGTDEPVKSLEITGIYPNPFTDWTSVRFNAITPDEVTFQVFTLLGEKIHEEKMLARPGENSLLFNGMSLNPGAYFYVVRSGNHSTSRLMIRAD